MYEIPIKINRLNENKAKISLGSFWKNIEVGVGLIHLILRDKHWTTRLQRITSRSTANAMKWIDARKVSNSNEGTFLKSDCLLLKNVFILKCFICRYSSRFAASTIIARAGSECRAIFRNMFPRKWKLEIYNDKILSAVSAYIQRLDIAKRSNASNVTKIFHFYVKINFTFKSLLIRTHSVLCTNLP